MTFSVELIKLIASSLEGSVFKARYLDRDVAIKFRARSYNMYNAVQEWTKLTHLREVPGIPRPIQFFPDFYCTKDSIGDFELPSDILIRHPTDFYCSPIIMQLVEADSEFYFVGGRSRDVDEREQTRTFPSHTFDQLEETVRGIHKMGLYIPFDATVMVAKDRPYIIDLSTTPGFAPAPMISKWVQQQNLKQLQDLRALYCER